MGERGLSGKVIYLDNAATSFPKPKEVWDAVLNYACSIGANPGRSGHRLSVEAARLVFNCRRALAELLGVSACDRIIFTKNATEAANVVIRGLLEGVGGGNVVATCLEHNAVARPLKYWCRREDIELRVVSCSPSGEVNPKKVLEAVDESTIAVFVNHASNVFGTVTPFEDIAAFVSVPVVVDATQTLGSYPFSVGDFSNVIVVFTGHKGLLGPQGTGGFYIPEGIELDPLIRGGTGSNSESDEQPSFLPDRFESGTLNVHGIAGLLAGIRWIKSRGIENIRKHELELACLFVEAVSSVKGVDVYASGDWSRRIGVVSLNVRGRDPGVVSHILDSEYGIATRAGLHCAPWAHRALGTYPVGTVRFSFGPFNTESDVEEAVRAVKNIGEGANGC